MRTPVSSRFRHHAGGFLLALLLSSCGREKVAQRSTVVVDSAAAMAKLPPGHPTVAPAAELSDAARAVLESGNVEFRAKRFDAARRFYEQAATMAPNHAAPWFGLYMIGDVTKNKQLADSALAEVRKRTGGTGAPVGSDTALRNPHARQPGT